MAQRAPATLANSIRVTFSGVIADEVGQVGGVFQRAAGQQPVFAGSAGPLMRILAQA